MMNVQRSSPDGRVEPQANGGRKILAHCMWDDIWSTHILIDVDSLVLSSIELRLLENKTDVLNILYIINEAFAERAEVVFSPKYAMMISHDDGKFDSAMNHSRDTLIMLNSFVELSRDYYTEEEINQIKLCQSME